MENLLTRWLGVRPQERRRTALLFFYLFLATLFVILGRTARDALFLSRANIAQLPWMYVGIALATSLAASIYAKLLTLRVSLYSLLQGTLALVLIFLWASRILIEARWAPIYSIFYVGMEVAGSLTVLQFWTFVNESFDAREAKRLFSVIGSGGILGAVCGGFLGSLLVRVIETPNLLWVCSIAVLCCVFLAYRASRLASNPLSAEILTRVRHSRRQRGLIESLGHSRYTLLLGAMAVLLTVAVSLIDYQFKYVAQLNYREAELAALFGLLYGVCGIFSFALHFFFTGRILMRFGILLPLVALPISLLLGSVTLIVWPAAFIPLLLTKGADTTLRYSLYDSVLQLLYIPLPVPIRRRVKAAIDGVIKPTSIALTGVLLLVVGTLSTKILGLVLMGLLFLWLLAAFNVRTGYSRALMASLTQGLRPSDIHIPLNDVASIRALVEALQNGEPQAVCAALELLPENQGHHWAKYVLPLLGAPRSQIRMSALRYVSREGIEVPTGRMEALLNDPNPQVRAFAVGWYGRFELDGIEGRLLTFLRDRGAEVRATAAVQLVRRTHVHRQRCLDGLHVMAESHDEETRQWAAWGLGEIGDPTAIPYIQQLLDDQISAVQRAAIEAAGKLQDDALMHALLGLMGSRVGGEAAQALSFYREKAIPLLLEGLDGFGGGETYRFHLIQAIKAVGDATLVRGLLQNLPENGDERHELLRVSYAIVRKNLKESIELSIVRESLMQELRICYQGWAIIADLDDGPEWTLLREALLYDMGQNRQRIFLLIALAYPNRSVTELYEAIESGRKGIVANAIEILDELLQGDIRGLVLPLIDDMPAEERLQVMDGRLDVRRRGANQWLLRLLNPGQERWVRVCAIHTIGALGNRKLGESVEPLLEEADPVIRETAISALSNLYETEALHSIYQRFKQDPEEMVSRLVKAKLKDMRRAVG